MSEILNTNIGRKVSEVSPSDLKILIAGFLDQANKVMGRPADDKEISYLIEWTYDYLTGKCGYMPIHHVRSAIESGSLGERGGTTRLIPRNIAIWLSEQKAIIQQQFARSIKKEDEHKRLADMNHNKAEGFVATAVRIKVHWLCDGLITSKQYDTFSSKLIYDKLKAGVAERDIHPRDIVPDYQNTII